MYAEERWFVGDEAPSEGALRSRLEMAEPAWEATFVAESDRSLSGWIEMRRYRVQRLAHVATLTVAVDASSRGSGTGRRLLRAGVEWARSVGTLKLRLDVRAGNDAARRLYEREGFVIEGRERHQIALANGRYEDNLLMARWLGDEERSSSPVRLTAPES